MKKIIKITALILLLLALIFFSMGIFTPSFSFQNKVIVNKSLAESFFKFNDPTRMKDWIPGFKRIGWISGLPAQTGSKWLLTIEQDGKEYQMVETMTGFKTNELFSFHLENEVLENDVTIHFSAKGNQTEIVADNFVKGKNIFWRSLFGFIKGYFSDSQQKSYESLKKIIEQ